MNTREVTRQYRLNQWIEIIQECRSSGQTISSWCAAHNIKLQSYYYWLKIVRTAACESLPVVGENTQSIVPVKISSSITAGSPTVQESSSHITLQMGSVTLALHNGASTALIENTLKALSLVR
ncbi:IS66 family insertion sequence element accessory protein TnpA [Sporomusa acidovorans]|uniref:IS66 family insertion sequence element accessory protein TnpA n=1 Tax=Sporomusa acidovorans TaxID=112900 RepID=UPI0008902562|nr:IS66 family transposase [Sporomusa acidovorans]OZC19012.1 hypothetical protein SPACI_30980 [Sporomusa acidovorans DSM 3132]SDD73102.1 hypothetical protein SAMN04488499_1003186 [Sporomusa acidovorans]